MCCQLLLTITCNVLSSTSSTCALRCIISVYCINHSLDKHCLIIKIIIFSYTSDLTYNFGAEKNRLIATVILYTHSIMFWLRNETINSL